MKEILGFLFVATVIGILIRILVTAALGAIAAATGEAIPPVAVVAAIASLIGAVAALGSFVVALMKLFSP